MGAKKLGRNEPCWCGSGKKYKRCHLPREAQRPVKPSEIDEAAARVFRRRKCSAPEVWHESCSQPARAHSIQKAGSLEKIARDRHVYAFRPPPLGARLQGERMKPRLIGLNEASTFTGFCSKHDNDIFREIETQPFTATSHQCFLLDYRAICRELYVKEGIASVVDIRGQLDRGQPRSVQERVQGIHAAFRFGEQRGLRNFSSHKTRLDGFLLSGDFDAIRAYVVELEHPPPVMCCSPFVPEQDFLGRRLVELPSFDSIPPYISVSSFHGGNAGIVVFTWPREYDSVNIRFIQSLAAISDSDLSATLLRLFFEKFENTYMAPNWWEQLPHGVQNAVIDRMEYGGMPYVAGKLDRLTDDGVRFPAWIVTGRRCIGFSL